MRLMAQVNQHPLYGIWQAMKRRCNNPNCKAYQWYGARGIKVCSEWQTFQGFLAGVGERPTPKHQLDRHPDKNGNYEPGNVRWATSQQQQSNKRNNVLLTWQGKTQTATEWATELGLPVERTLWRVNHGLPVEQVLAKEHRPKGNPVLLTLDGETHSLEGWTRLLNLGKGTIRYRLTLGWTVEKALRTPSSRQMQPKRPAPA